MVIIQFDPVKGKGLKMKGAHKQNQPKCLIYYLTYYCLLFHVDCIKKLKSNCVEDVKKDGVP